MAKTKFSRTLVTALGNNNASPVEWDYSGLPVTPADATVLPDGIARALYCTGTGNIAVTLESGATATLTSVPANTIVPISVSIVAATGTTATGIFALYQ